MKKIFIVSLCLVMLMSMAACDAVDTSMKDNTQTKVITDSLGRKVEVPEQVNSVVSLGVMRLLVYMQANDIVKGATDMDNVTELTRPYTYAYPENVSLPVVSQGGAGGIVPFDEEIIKLQPDVIFIVSDYPQPDELSDKLGIPVVAVTNPELFNGVMSKSLEIIGEVLGKEDRAAEINDFMDTCQQDLKKRTQDIPVEERPTVYNGGLNFKGKHGFDGTSAKYGPFMAVNAVNVADETGQSSAFTVDLEKVMEWNPDIIFVNPENMDLINEQYKKNSEFFNSLDAVKEGKVYTQLAYNNNYTNVEIALIDAYFAGKIIYPEKFEDIDPEQKADEIFKFLLGKKMYSDFEDAGQGLGQVKIGE